MFIVASISIFTTHKDTWFGIYTIESQNKLSERSLAKQFTRILLDPRKLFISELMLYIRRSSVSHRKQAKTLTLSKYSLFPLIRWTSFKSYEISPNRWAAPILNSPYYRNLPPDVSIDNRSTENICLCALVGFAESWLPWERICNKVLVKRKDSITLVRFGWGHCLCSFVHLNIVRRRLKAFLFIIRLTILGKIDFERLSLFTELAQTSGSV